MNKSKCPDNVRFAGKERYPDKVMVWVAMSIRGISKPLFRLSKFEAEHLYKRMLRETPASFHP